MLIRSSSIDLNPYIEKACMADLGFYCREVDTAIPGEVSVCVYVCVHTHVCLYSCSCVCVNIVQLRKFDELDAYVVLSCEENFVFLPVTDMVSTVK